MIILQIRLKAVFVFWFSIKSEAKVVILLTKKSSTVIKKNSVRVCVGHRRYCACSPLCWRSRAEGERKEYNGKGSGRKEGV